MVRGDNMRRKCFFFFYIVSPITKTMSIDILKNNDNNAHSQKKWLLKNILSLLIDETPKKYYIFILVTKKNNHKNETMEHKNKFWQRRSGGERLKNEIIYLCNHTPHTIDFTYNNIMKFM